MQPKKAKRPTGVCVFCGEPKVTKAHIFPEWLGLYITEKSPKHIATIGEFETFKPITRTPEFSARVKQGHTGTRFVRRVCAKCNSGWLGDFEEPAKPIVLALMNGGDVFIDTETQMKIVPWVSAITTLLDLADSDGSAIGQEDRNYFRDTLLPPSHWRIWIARYCGRDWTQHRARRMAMRLFRTPAENDLSTICNTQATTLVIRELCVHVFTSQIHQDFSGYGGISLLQLWPSTDSSFMWLHAPLVDDADVAHLAEAAARGFTQIPK